MSIKVRLKTLTPIHIGTGKNLEPENFFYSGGKVFLLNIDNCLQFIKSKIGRDSFFQNFNQWINNVAFSTEISAGSRARVELGLSIFDFVQNQLKMHSLLKELQDEIPKNNSLYHYYTSSFSNPKREVKEQIKTANNQPYIPGSSFKGLLRNCLLNYELNFNLDKYHKFLSEQVSKRLNKINSKIQRARIENKKINYQSLKFDDSKSIENEIFSCMHLNGRGEKRFDPKYDLFKFIQISDFYPNTQDCLKIVDVYNITPKGLSKLSLTLEAIAEETEFVGTITIKVDELKELYKHLQKSKNQNEWLGLENKFPNVFGFPISSLLQYEASTVEEIFKKRLNDAIEDFSSSIINKDLVWLSKIQYEHKNIIENFYDSLPANSLKIGFSSGFHAVTIYDVLVNAKDNPNLANNYFELLRKLKIINNNNLFFPKHRKVVKLSQNTEATFGWVSVDLI